MGYAIYMVVLIFAFLLSNYILTYLQELTRKTFQPLPYFTFSIVLYVVLGALLGSEHLFIEIKKQGKWRINIPKLIFLGIPSLVCVFPILFYPLIHSLLNNPALISVIQVIFGYAVTSSFYKSSPEESPPHLEETQKQA